MVFTRRTLHVALHKGEISLPGGAHEDSDASLLETAIRELGEELGVAAAGLKVLGRLPTVYTKVSNFAVNPYVAVASRRPCFRADPAEVAEVLEIPLQALCDPAALHEEENEWQGEKARMLFFQCGEYKIWGATARIVHEFLTVLGKPRRDNV